VLEVIVALRAGKMKTYANCDRDSDETGDRRIVDGKGYRVQEVERGRTSAIGEMRRERCGAN
jgi:hypothetical protein